MKSFYSGEFTPSGTVQRTARYLGPFLADKGNITEETRLRIIAMKHGWASMRNFWRAVIPMSYKRVVLIARVYNAGLSAMTSFVPTQTYYGQVNRLMGKYMRSITWHKWPKRAANRAPGYMWLWP